MIKRLKKGLCLALASLIVMISVSGSYAVTASAEAVTTAASIMQALEAIFLAFGTSYITTDMIANYETWGTDGSSALDDSWQPVYDDMENKYDNKRSEIINNGGGSNNKGDPNYINTFAEMIAATISSQKLDLTNDGIWECLQDWANTTLRDARALGITLADMTTPNLKTNTMFDIVGFDNVLNYLDKYDSYVYFKDTLSDRYEWAFGNLKSIDETSHKVTLKNSTWGFYMASLNPDTYWPASTNYEYTITNIYGIGVTNCRYKVFAFVYPNKGDTLKDYWTAEGSGDPNNIQMYPPLLDNGATSLDIPSLQAIQQLISNSLGTDGQPDASKVPGLVQQLINSLANTATDPGTDPDPGTNPGTNPNPDPGTETEPITESSPEQEANEGGFLANGLSNVFPFCIPWDLIRAFKLLSAPAQAPHINWTLKVDRIGLNYTFDIDFTDFESVAAIFRTLETIGFIIALIMITRNMTKN